MDWIEDIVENTYRNYSNRQIVLWGKYSVSEEITDRLKDIYGIDTAFYVDKDPSKIDNKQVFPTGCLQGKSDEYYVVVPVAYYKSLKDELDGGGYKKNQDYYYFCDCIVKMTDDYYEDSHGNKIIGAYNKLKFVFSGFNSVVRIGENVNLHNSSFYIHSDAEIEIGDSCTIEDSVWNTDGAQIGVGDGCIISNCVWNADGAHIEIGKKCGIYNNYLLAKPQSYVKLGDGGRYQEGRIAVREHAQIIIGRAFSIESGYSVHVLLNTQIIIGDDVMCSHAVSFWSSDGHSIFDLRTGMNISSTEAISKTRKIVIGNHVWIGSNAIILYNTEIRDGSIIGAGSLVKSRIPNNCIAAGAPAQVIRKDIAWSRKYGADQLMEHEQAYARLTEI